MAFSWLLNGAYKSWDDLPPVSKKIVAILLMLEIQLSPAEVGNISLFTTGFSTILSVVFSPDFWLPSTSYFAAIF